VSGSGISRQLTISDPTTQFFMGFVPFLPTASKHWRQVLCMPIYESNALKAAKPRCRVDETNTSEDGWMDGCCYSYTLLPAAATHEWFSSSLAIESISVLSTATAGSRFIVLDTGLRLATVVIVYTAFHRTRQNHMFTVTHFCAYWSRFWSRTFWE